MSAKQKPKSVCDRTNRYDNNRCINCGSKTGQECNRLNKQK